MPPRTKRVGTTLRAGLPAALVVLGVSASARAGDLSDELTVGAVSSSTSPTTAPYLSDRLGGTIEPNEHVALSLDGTFTRYFKANHEPGENIFQLAPALDYMPDEHWSLGLDARGSPPSTAITRTTDGNVRSRTSLLGAGVSVEYDTAGESDAETVLETYLGVTSYSTTQRSRALGRTSPTSLTQFRASLGVTEVLWRETEAGISGSAYAYSMDPSGTGYFGESVFGRESLAEGLPLEPLRWSVRPTLRQRVGPVRVSAYFQYGRYVDDAGWNVFGGLKAQIRLTDAWRVWISANLQHDVEGQGGTLSIPWAAVGARVTL